MVQDSRVIFQPSSMRRRLDEDGDVYISVSDLLGNIGMLRLEVAEKLDIEEFLVSTSAMLMGLDSVIALLVKAENLTNE